jgi:hypothetical protein
MKEVSNFAQVKDNVAADAGKTESGAGSMAVDSWKEMTATLGKKEAASSQDNVKCVVITDIYGNSTKGCYTPPQDLLPGKPSTLENPLKPILKPEIPADGGLKDPIKNPIKEPSLDGGIKDPIKKPMLEDDIKKPFKPQVNDSIEFGEPFVKPVPKPGKIIKSSAAVNSTLE